MNVERLDTHLQSLKTVNAFVHGGVMSRIIGSQIWSFLFFRRDLVIQAAMRDEMNWQQKDEAVEREQIRDAEYHDILNWASLMCPDSYLPDVEEAVQGFADNAHAKLPEGEEDELVDAIVDEYDGEFTREEIVKQRTELLANKKDSFETIRKGVTAELVLMLKGRQLFINDDEAYDAAVEGGIPVSEVDHQREFNPTPHQILKILQSIGKSVGTRIEKNRKQILANAYVKESLAENKLLRSLDASVEQDYNTLAAELELGNGYNVATGSSQHQRIAVRQQKEKEQKGFIARVLNW